MKTAEKILLTSLEMFNQHGEANITCVDIAVELDISPGNLYYHFKGKESIVNALFDMYLQRSSKILISPNTADLDINQFFLYLLRLLESVHLFRFIYRNPTDLMHKYSNIARNFKRLVKSKEQAFIAIIEHFSDIGLMQTNKAQALSLAQMINLVFTQSQSYFMLKGLESDDENCFNGLTWIFHTISPYLAISESEKQAVLSAITEHRL